jgi:O-antigen/teichoic acid export membrane protein
LRIDVEVQNQVGSPEYGFYFAIFNFAFLFQMLLDMGITNFNNRNISQNNQLLKKHFSSIVVLRFLFSMGYMAFILLVGWLIGYDERQMWMLTLVGINQFLLTMILYLRSNIAALMMFKIDSLISVMDRLLMILICTILLNDWLGWGQFRIEWFVYAQTTAYILTALVAFMVVFKKAGFMRYHWNSAFFITIIKKSFPYALLAFFMGMYHRLDAVFLERLLGDDGDLQAGIYASAYRLLDVANNMSGVLFAALLLPLFSRMLKQKEDVSALVKLAFTLLFVVSSTAAIVSIFYGQDIMQLLYHIHEDESIVDYGFRMQQTALVFTILMFVYMATSTTYVFGTLLTANGSLKTLNKVAFGGMMISIVLNLSLIPIMKVTGSAIASLSAQMITAILQLIIAFRLINLKIDRAYWLRLILFFGILISAAFGSQYIVTEWYFRLGALLVFAVILSMALNLLDLRAFLQMAFAKKEE